MSYFKYVSSSHTEFNKEQFSDRMNHSIKQKLVILNENETMRDFQQQVSLQWNEDELKTNIT